MAYYEIILGSGFYYCWRFVLKVEHPTTDYGALTDMFIDWAKEEGYHFILDMENDYEWDTNYETFHEKDYPDRVYYPDEYVIGGNAGDVLLHLGEFRINQIEVEEIGDSEIVDLEEG